MATKVFPTNGNVGGGRVMDEESLSAVFGLAVDSYVVSGFTISDAVSPYTAIVAAGVAIISGYLVTTTTSLQTGAGPGETVYAFLQLIRDGNGRVTGAQVATSYTSTLLTDSVLLGRFTITGSDATSIVDMRQLGSNVDPHVITLFHAATGLATSSTSYVAVNSALFAWAAVYARGRAVYLEAVLSTASGGTATLRLMAGASELGSVSATETSPTRKRSSALTIANAADLTCELKTNNGSYAATLYAVRLIIL